MYVLWIEDCHSICPFCLWIMSTWIRQRSRSVSAWAPFTRCYRAVLSQNGHWPFDPFGWRFELKVLLYTRDTLVVLWSLSHSHPPRLVDLIFQVPEEYLNSRDCILHCRELTSYTFSSRLATLYSNYTHCIHAYCPGRCLCTVLRSTSCGVANTRLHSGMT